MEITRFYFFLDAEIFNKIKNICLEGLFVQLTSSVLHCFDKKVSLLCSVNTAYIIPFCMMTLNKGNVLRTGWFPVLLV